MSRILFFLNPNGLMDRDLAAAINEAGHELLVEEIRLARTSEGHQAELISSERYIGLLENFKPELVLSFNGLGVDNEGFCAGELFKRGIPYVSWYVDQPRQANLGARYNPANTHFFCFDRYFVPKLEEWGFVHSHYLPLATNPARFKPLAQAPREETVCFVGESDYAKISYLAANLDRELGSLGDSFYDSLDEAINVVMQSPGCHILELVRAVLELTGLEWASLTAMQQDMLEGFVEREAGLRLRLALLAALHERYPLTIYGDELWTRTFGAACRGKANYFDETIVQVYNRHTVHVNISKFQLVTAVNQRPFDIAACGGFVLTDERASLRELFEPDEIASYTREDELVELTGYYLKHAAERTAFAEKARARVLREHTYGRRLDELLVTVLG
ncbi:MAG: hypothetical protein BWY87_00355 [Deltaproteobacteria bacterium ADurb.Bin510]|nr:MAG: hypothetical protein BWY87_00355 [Deltaproteobacteria bacterium ADurb.Bin510]